MALELFFLIYDGAMLLVCSYCKWKHAFSILSLWQVFLSHSSSPIEY